MLLAITTKFGLVRSPNSGSVALHLDNSSALVIGYKCVVIGRTRQQKENLDPSRKGRTPDSEVNRLTCHQIA